MQYVLAGASSTGYTVVWDLRGKREVVALAYGGSNAIMGSGGSIGARRGMSDIAWHPDNVRVSPGRFSLSCIITHETGYKISHCK